MILCGFSVSTNVQQHGELYLDLGAHGCGIIGKFLNGSSNIVQVDQDHDLAIPHSCSIGFFTGLVTAHAKFFSSTLQLKCNDEQHEQYVHVS